MITALEAIPCSAPFAADAPAWQRHPAAHFARFPRRGQDTVLVRITDADAVVGIGEAWGLPAPRATAALVEDWLAPLVVGREAAAVRSDWGALHDHLLSLGHAEGSGLDALAGIDIALVDLLAQRAGVPACRFLGGEPGDCAVYAAPVALRADPAETVAAARALVAAGHRGLKPKIGRGPERDREHLQALRAELGSTIELRVDANGAYDAPTAIAVARAIADLDIVWFEDPVAGGDLAGLRAVRRAGGLRVASGESLHGTAAFARLVAAEAVDVLVPNLARVGGFEGLRRIIALAQAADVAVAPHGVGSGLLQAATLHAMAAWLPTGIMEWNVFPNPLREALVAPRPAVTAGRATPPPGPGLGVQAQAAAIERYRVDHAPCA